MATEHKITATDEQVISYLTSLWTGKEIVIPELKQNADKQEYIYQPEISNNISINDNNLNDFSSSVQNNLNELKQVGYKAYGEKKLEKQVNLHVETVTETEIQQVYQIKTEKEIIPRKKLMKDIAKCNVFPKYKSGDGKKPEHFRYLVNHSNPVKIFDRLWSVEVVTLCGNSLPDKNIFKASLVKNWNKSIVETAMENTMDTKGVVLLDITRAFDSIEWSIARLLLTNSLENKIGETKGNQLVNQYMEILSNRELYYKSTIIPCSKGIPTGLPSSTIVFTLIMEEIINNWLQENNIIVGEKFKLNIYVDDIYIKFYDDVTLEDKISIINSLTNTLAKFGLIVNAEKSKADPELHIQSIIPTDLQNTDLYLGIPFTRDIKLYGQVIMNELNKRYGWTWVDVMNNIKPSDDLSSVGSDSDDEELREKVPTINRKVLGFLIYKLSPFIEKNSDIPLGQLIIDFISSNFM
jgi:hypothetical protein